MTKTASHNPWVTVKPPATVAIASAVMSAREAAQFIGVSERTLYSLTVPRGGIPVTRFGTGEKVPPRYLHADLEAFLDAHRVTAAKEERGDV